MHGLCERCGGLIVDSDFPDDDTTNIRYCESCSIVSDAIEYDFQPLSHGICEHCGALIIDSDFPDDDTTNIRYCESCAIVADAIEYDFDPDADDY